MSQFRTTDEQKVILYEIAAMMKQANLSASFISSAVGLAEYYEGAFDLMQLWAEETKEDERENIVSDIQEEIDEYEEQPKTPVKKPYFNYDMLDRIANDVTTFKGHLKNKVDQWGGIAKLSRETGIPQPSLSRFFSSPSMPRRTTLYKIAEAVGLTEEDIIVDWVA